MIRHVIDTCDQSVYYLNRFTDRSRIRASYAVLCPFKDEIVKALKSRCNVIEGPEDDVLARYQTMSEKLSPDYIVRVTADCPLIPPFLITKLIKLAVVNEYDYCSNVDEKVRTSMDGHDVEVMSKRALEWANVTATDPSLREHVTQILRSHLIPSDFKTSTVVNFLNQSHVKLSVDTPEDLERVRIEYERAKSSTDAAEALFGRSHVHRF